MSTVVVTGGAGFIGSNLTRSLLADNYKVVCVDNFLTSFRNNIEELFNHPNYIFIEHDVSKPWQDIQGKIGQIDYIFHLASPASPNMKSPRSYMSYPIETLLVNSQGTHHLLELLKGSQGKFLYASTSEAYGDPEISPQPETYNGNVNPNGIRSVYDEAKRFGEAMTFGYMRKYGIDTRIVRIFNTYGPFMQKDDGRVVSNFINQALENKPLTIYGDGSQTRSFCYIADMVEGLKKAMFQEGTKGEVINLGNPDERTIKDFADLIKHMTHSQSEIITEPLPLDDPKIRQPDITKAKNILGWEPSVKLEDGLTKTISYFSSV
jgi:nucleoside-diphosphate-sugar epimerase